MARTGRCLLWGAFAAGVVIVLAAAAVGLFWRLATAPAPQSAQPQSTAGPAGGAQSAPPASGASQTGASPGSPRQLGGGRQPRTTEAPARAAASSRFQLTISAPELQQMAAAAVGNSVQGLQVAITGGQVVLSGKVQVGKRWVPVTVRTRPQAEGGKLRLAVTGAYIGRLPAPASARREVQKKLDELTARALSHLPGAQVTSVQVTEGQIVIEGQMSGTR